MIKALAVALLLTTTPEAIYHDYQKNPEAADRKYLGKRLTIKGKIAAVSASMVIDFAVNGTKDTVTATLTDEQVGRGWSLKPGQELELVCTGLGLVMGTPLVARCEFP